jgi:uncharacterized protein
MPIDAASDNHAAWLRWREARLRTLRAPDGWLTLVGLAFLDDGVWTIGADPACGVHAPGASQPVIGTLQVSGDQVRFLPKRESDGSTQPLVYEGIDPSAASLEGDGIPLRADDAGGPSIVRDGELSIALIRRNGKLALRMRDNRSPLREALRSIPTYSYAPTLLCPGIAHPPEPGATLAITNITGFVETQPIVAILRFTLPSTARGGGAIERSLIATAGANGSLFIVFADATNRETTYPGGRFLTVDPPDASGRVLLDFNRAINPVCALVPFATCPTPPLENRLPERIEAGERYPPEMTPCL